MKKIKKLIAVALVFTLFMCTLVSANVKKVRADEPVEITYKNSLLVDVKTPEPKDFSIDDFKEAEPLQVAVTGYSENESGYDYELVLSFENSGEAFLEEMMEILNQNDIVKAVERNKYVDTECEAVLNNNEITLEVGETAELKVERYHQNSGYHIGAVYFTIDPEYFDAEWIGRDSFRRYGIEKFWPCKVDDTDIDADKILNFEPSRYGKYEGQKSTAEDNLYVGFLSEEYADMNTYLQVMEEMNSFSDKVRTVNLGLVKDPPTGIPAYETWNISNEKNAEISLSSREETIEVGPFGFMYQTCTVEAISPGKAEVTVNIGGFGTVLASASCTVNVVNNNRKLGDVDGNRFVGASDALLALKYAARLDQLDAAQQIAADVNKDGKIDADDALQILKVAAKLDVFRISVELEVGEEYIIDGLFDAGCGKYTWYYEVSPEIGIRIERILKTLPSTPLPLPEDIIIGGSSEQIFKIIAEDAGIYEIYMKLSDNVEPEEILDERIYEIHVKEPEPEADRTEINLEVGKEYVIDGMFDRNSHMHSWTYEVNPDTGLSIEESRKPMPEGSAPGTAEEQVFTICPEEAGIYEVHFKLCEFGDPTRETIDEKVYVIYAYVYEDEPAHPTE